MGRDIEFRCQEGWKIERFDTIIVGAGPAGIFAALELVQDNPRMRILLLDKGPDLDSRVLQRSISHAHANGGVNAGGKEDVMDSYLSGWGGAGAFSDGKLNLTPEVGGSLNKYMEEIELLNLIDYVDSLYLKFGAPKELHGTNREEIGKIAEAAARYDLKLIPFKIRHLGTNLCVPLLKKIRDELTGRLEVRFNTSVEEILVDGNKVAGIRTNDGLEIRSRYVIIAPGRGGAEWLGRLAKSLNLTTLINPVDIGVRVEVPASVMKAITDVVYESKFVFYSKMFDDQVRTFCMNPYGEVIKESNRGIFTVNGHSYSNKRTENTNFAILVSTLFTEPFHEPIEYGQYIARLANLLGGGVIVQRLGDLIHGRRSTTERIRKGIVSPTLEGATPGDLSFVIPYRYLSDIMEMLEALDNIAPGVNSRHTLLYGVEVKFYSLRIMLTKELETQVKNLFAIGDGAGITRGLMQASASGVAAARSILKRTGVY